VKPEQPDTYSLLDCSDSWGSTVTWHICIQKHVITPSPDIDECLSKSTDGFKCSAWIPRNVVYIFCTCQTDVITTVSQTRDLDSLMLQIISSTYQLVRTNQHIINILNWDKRIAIIKSLFSKPLRMTS